MENSTFLASKEEIKKRMIEWRLHEVKIYQAIDLAARIHHNQTYGKEPIVYPYIFHLKEVAQVLAQYVSEITSPDLFVAAWLHDSIEDQSDKINWTYIKLGYGENVANIVLAVTDDKKDDGESYSRKERATRLFERLRKYPNDDALKIKLCDRIANVGHSLSMDKLGVNNLLDMYRKEYDDFRFNLKPLSNDTVVSQMWEKLDILMDFEG